MKVKHNYDENIKKHGCQIICVTEDGDLPPFAYSIGIYKRLRKPELIVIGLKNELSMSIINEYCRLANDLKIIPDTGRYSGFLHGHDVRFIKVKKSYYDDYLGQCQSYYGSNKFSILQLVYPNTSGIWPDSKDSNDWFRNRQPILNGKSAQQVD